MLCSVLRWAMLSAIGTARLELVVVPPSVGNTLTRSALLRRYCTCAFSSTRRPLLAAPAAAARSAAPAEAAAAAGRRGRLRPA